MPILQQLCLLHENGGSQGKLSDLPKATQLACGRARLTPGPSGCTVLLECVLGRTYWGQGGQFISAARSQEGAGNLSQLPFGLFPQLSVPPASCG